MKGPFHPAALLPRLCRSHHFAKALDLTFLFGELFLQRDDLRLVFYETRCLLMNGQAPAVELLTQVLTARLEGGEFTWGRWRG